MGGQTPSLADVIQTAIDDRFGRAFTAMPGYVRKYDAARQVAEIDPAVGYTYENEAGKKVEDAYPTLVNVPVVFPGSVFSTRPGGGGSGDHSITWPVSEGDTCLLIFCSCETKTWLQSYGVYARPHGEQRQHISDAVAIMGLRVNAARILPPPPNDGITITSAKVRLGSGAASQAAAMKRDVDRVKGALLDTAVVAGIAAAAADGGSSYKIAVNAYFVANPITGASKVLVE